MSFRAALALAGICQLLPVLSAAPAQAHPGGLNAQGCHNNRKTGDYHCHRTGRSSERRATAQIDGSVYFPNCDAARAAGAAPIRRGQPGYRPALDRDNDGIACEPYRGR